MHRSLYIVDIIELICAAVDHPTLAALTSTCGQFHRPAVAALWNNMHTFHPFIKSFSSDAWGVDRRGNLVSFNDVFRRHPMCLYHQLAEIDSATRTRRLGSLPILRKICARVQPRTLPSPVRRQVVQCAMHSPASPSSLSQRRPLHVVQT